MDFILVRHGVTDWNEQGRLMGRLDIELNARGREQAEAVAEALRSVPVHSVRASPQRRAQQTAEAIARVHGLAVRSEAALAEVWLGRWEARTWSDLQADADVVRYLADPTYVCDAAEPASGVHQRIVGFVEQVRTEGTGTAVLVSHGDPLRVLLAHYLAMPLAAYRHLEVAPASVSRLRFDAAGAAHLGLLNWQPQGGSDQLR